ncbi:LysR family transcriptional regulator [Variovorax rhizosphaerae]|uniref:LysR family transcriptional regulator n=1 Tax=Variovorax rhizosphaerae TaxID=1836200 RepID=A0ABU8WXT0_9BURK
MDLRRLEHFVALYEQGTFHKASEAVHLSQSALSRSIQALESDLGIALFDRLVHGTVLTPAGRLLLPGVQKMLADAKDLRRQVELFTAGDLGEIRIGTSPTPGAVLLRPLLVEVTRSRPDLHIDARIGSNADLVVGLQAEKFDLIVLDSTSLETPGGFEVEQLAPQEGGFLVRHGHPLADRQEIVVEELASYPVAGVGSTAAFGRRLVDALGPRAHPSLLITHFCDSYQVLRDLALRTDAVILSLYSILQEEIEAGLIAPVIMRLHAPMPVGYYAMVRLAHRSTSPALELVQRSIRGVFDGSREVCGASDLGGPTIEGHHGNSRYEA